MNASTSAERVRQEIVRLCHAGLDSRTFRVETVRRLRKLIPIDVSFFATADPATLLFTGAVVDDVLAQATPPIHRERIPEGRFSKVRPLGEGTLAGRQLGHGDQG